MELEVTGAVWYWRGPSPYHFVTVPDDAAERIGEVAGLVSYGWGVIPVTARCGGATFTTSLFPKDGGYAVPLKAAVRRAEGIELDDVVTLRLEIAGP
ncbi:DUF1905 domain-containing protein [Cellulomonas sp. PhB143]|uniref:DUF1905 domain-containing protein n=1 Tax=Cellulomonas sp. PhB143 TaxID=2485186 RepID=UPI000F495988|nr:DUF1905 domain-containing protein [Cellulomonas sp. PhB143]ROS75449.1 uncharacterized protein DUF1905 [Cellulomonas sp. PhB143]